MVIDKYVLELNSIKRKLNRYSDISFLLRMHQHLGTFRNKQHGVILNLPWCCFLALKWKFSANPVNNKEMSNREFVDIVNRVYRLQEYAISFYKDKQIFLSMRRIMIPQMLFQSGWKMDINSLARQYIWFCQMDKEYYRAIFKKITGFSLDDFYKISSYLSVICYANDNSDSGSLHLNAIVIHLLPKFGLETIFLYLKFVSLRFDEVRGFMQSHKYDDNRKSEYFEDTPLISKPIILIDEKLIFLSKKILNVSLSNMIPNLLKAHHGTKFKEKFGKLMEKYVGDLLADLNVELLTEDDIHREYRKNNIKGKVVDFIIRYDNSSVFIDSKAIEPDKVIKTTDYAKTLKDRLKNSFTKGIIQGQECASKLSLLGYGNNLENDSLIIVTHKDHHIPTGKMIGDLIDEQLFDMIETKYGEVKIKKERIYYITVDDLEDLIYISKEKGITITEIINKCVKDDSNKSGEKASFNMHINSYFKSGIPDREDIIKHREYLINESIEYARDANQVWDGLANDYIPAYIQLRRQLGF
ncbi:GapS1 family protein [Yersinia kristensenii]|uniref:Restriction endonuclease n=1 Tax=Yersinia kristensenii TaxID=28152 RepID=A0AB73P5F4_YERKR|nr:hypothetical protein [Yersinia kristensenii]OVZ81474.1 hypothetical protein CBW52_10410 [Yersinia kristensenii]